jgi:TolB protein
MRSVVACLVLVAVGVSVAQPLSRVVSLGVAAPGQIAFVAPDGRPARVDPVTRVVLPLVDGPWHASTRVAFPVWAPDGQRVAYLTTSPGRAGVEVVDLRGGTGPVSVYDSRRHPPIYVSWSPTGERLAVLAADDGSLALHVADVETGSSRLLTRGSPFYWTWNRAGDRLLVHRDVLRPGAVVGFTGLETFEVAHPLPDPGAFQAPALSPTERFVAYATRQAGDVRRVVVAPADAPAATPGERRELPHDGQAAVAWHPSRDVLAVQRTEPQGFSSISLLDAETGDLEVVVPGRSLAFFWSPDGAWLAYLTLQLGGPGVGPERLVSVHATPVTHDAPRRPHLTINVLDVETGESRAVAGFAPSALFVEQFLPFFDQYSRSHRVWSPGSDALVFPAVVADGTTMITVFGLDGSITPLAAGEMASWNVR